MNTKTILNVLIAILLCASTFASVVSAAGDDATGEDMHSVTITDDHEGEDEDNITITIAFVWEYPANMRGMADTEVAQAGTVDAREAIDYEPALGLLRLEEIHAASRSNH